VFLRKLDCIVYPFIIWTVILGVIGVEMAILAGEEGDFSRILRSIYYPQDHLWFLYTLFLVFLISILIYSPNDSSHHLPLLVVFAVFYVLEGRVSGVFPLNYIAENFVFFALGIVLYEIKDWIEKLSFMHTVILFGLFAALQIMFHDVFHYTFLDRGAFSLLVAITGILFVVSVSVSLSRYQPGFLVYLGQSSMVIYLMHVLSYPVFVSQLKISL
jgi:surface polysaccharide O-acyltransferase-like enzyme